AIPALFVDVAEVVIIAEKVLNPTDVPDTFFVGALCLNAHCRSASTKREAKLAPAKRIAKVKA
ncbi:hypothetical protein KAX17_11060, partial [Candidatus Bipolaricaulota bacterium]|nr:hypothetical protein [Candidatus Bipolaricaulota bacterium]